MSDAPPVSSEPSPLPPLDNESYVSNLLAAHSNESQLVWSRYNAMLTANAILAAIIAVFFSRTPTTRDTLLWLSVSGILGAILCWHWRLLTNDGWKFSSQLAKRIKDVAGPERDPLLTVFEVAHSSDDPIRQTAQRIIMGFLVAYLALGVAFGFKCAVFTAPEASQVATMCAPDSTHQSEMTTGRGDSATAPDSHTDPIPK